ncbi:hypothetical protein AB9K26_01915 [Psychroserpens sp. XS_ASV72]|uniref:hypothetical protein n=1 Tax=Psychroserpens sp. XS_ASV72 TaxID=3241293 RepID=UPI003510ED5D
MKLAVFIIFFVFCVFSIEKAHAQKDFAVLEKNVNVRAKDLSQRLNATKDTLILKSKTMIQKVYAVNMDYKREVDMSVMDTSVKIPLKNLSKGKHVFVAVQSPMRFVFVVKIIGDNSVLLAMDDTKVTPKK